MLIVFLRKIVFHQALYSIHSIWCTFCLIFRVLILNISVLPRKTFIVTGRNVHVLSIVREKITKNDSKRYNFRRDFSNKKCTSISCKHAYWLYLFKELINTIIEHSYESRDGLVLGWNYLLKYIDYIEYLNIIHMWYAFIVIILAL